MMSIMKKVEAIIKPFKLDEVKEALQGNLVEGLTLFGKLKDLVVKKDTEPL